MSARDRRALATARLAGVGLALGLTLGCEPAPSAVTASSAAARAARRAYDGAPPVIPHPVQSAACTSCHGGQAVAVPGLGVAPPSPHRLTPGMGPQARCAQCHVPIAAPGIFRESTFAGLAQDLRRGPRLYRGAPPVIPHGLALREDCLACHDGPAARAEIRTSHPERVRCRQCHVPRVTTGELARAPAT